MLGHPLSSLQPLLLNSFPFASPLELITGTRSSYLFNMRLMISSTDFFRSSVGRESACNAGDLGLIPGSGRSPGEGNGNPLQYSCLENPIDR